MQRGQCTNAMHMHVHAFHTHTINAHMIYTCMYLCGLYIAHGVYIMSTYASAVFFYNMKLCRCELCRLYIANDVHTMSTYASAIFVFYKCVCQYTYMQCKCMCMHFTHTRHQWYAHACNGGLYIAHGACIMSTSTSAAFFYSLKLLCLFVSLHHESCKTPWAQNKGLWLHCKEAVGVWLGERECWCKWCGYIAFQTIEIMWLPCWQICSSWQTPSRVDYRYGVGRCIWQSSCSRSSYAGDASELCKDKAIDKDKAKGKARAQGKVKAKDQSQGKSKAKAQGKGKAQAQSQVRSMESLETLPRSKANVQGKSAQVMTQTWRMQKWWALRMFVWWATVVDLAHCKNMFCFVHSCTFALCILAHCKNCKAAHFFNVHLVHSYDAHLFFVEN